jgi:hypothetical protein
MDENEVKEPEAKEPEAKEPEAKEPEAKEPEAKEPEVVQEQGMEGVEPVAPELEKEPEVTIKLSEAPVSHGTDAASDESTQPRRGKRRRSSAKDETESAAVPSKGLFMLGLQLCGFADLFFLIRLIMLHIVNAHAQLQMRSPRLLKKKRHRNGRGVAAERARRWRSKNRKRSPQSLQAEGEERESRRRRGKRRRRTTAARSSEAMTKSSLAMPQTMIPG